ncbi:MAG: hypothetical protein QW341_05600 [Candidatus Bathyarchaeia archaeon]
MDRGKLIKILLITFAILTAASAISLFYAIRNQPMRGKRLFWAHIRIEQHTTA